MNSKNEEDSHELSKLSQESEFSDLSSNIRMILLKLGAVALNTESAGNFST